MRRLLLNKLDKSDYGIQYLSREHWTFYKNYYLVKDLSKIGRELKDIIIVDNAPCSYMFHATNAIPISAWYKDVNDKELLKLIPVLSELSVVHDVREGIKDYKASKALETNGKIH